MGLFSRKNKTVFYGTEGSGASPQVSAGAQPAGDFVFRVEDTFHIRNRGLVVVGLVESGTISQFDKVAVETVFGVRATTVDQIEADRHTVPVVHAGQKAGLLLFGLTEADMAGKHVPRGARITRLPAAYESIVNVRHGLGAAALPEVPAPVWPPDNPAVPAPTAAPAPAGARPVFTPLGSTLRLSSIGDRKIAVIKELKEATGWGLADTKQVVDAAPVDVQLPIPPAAAGALVASLGRLGAQAELL